MKTHRKILLSESRATHFMSYAEHENSGRKANILRAAFSWLILLVMSLTAGEAEAVNNFLSNPSQSFRYYKKGNGCIHLTLMLCDNDGVDSGIIWFGVIDENGNKTDYLHQGFRGLHSDHVQMDARGTRDGAVFFVTNQSNTNASVQLGNTDGVYNVTRTGSFGYAELDWYYPASFAGKTFSLYVNGRTNGTTDIPTFVMGKETFETVDFNMYDPTLATAENDINTIRIPFISARPVAKVVAKYKTAKDGTEKTVEQTYGNPQNSGFFPLPAGEAHYGLTLTGSVKYSDHQIAEITTAAKDIPMIHCPKNLNAELLDDGKYSMKLTWSITDVGYEDMLNGDMFVVQRSLTGKDEDFTDIGMVDFDTNTQNYEYKDSLLLDALTKDNMSAGKAAQAKYRIYRAGTRIWGLEKNTTVLDVTPTYRRIALLAASGLKSEWLNEEEHTVKLNWDYESSDPFTNMVWSNQAQMEMRMRMYNRKGEKTDSLIRILTADEIRNKTMELPLPRPCVKYTFEINTLKGSLPFDVGYNLNAGSKEDWLSIAKYFSSEQSPRARITLTSDIDLSTKEASAQGVFWHFRGTIDGNGHTLKLMQQGETYSLIKEAHDGTVINNLNIEANISGNSNIAPFIGTAHGNVELNSCVLTGELRNTGSQLYPNIGGFISRVHEGANVMISNCLMRAGYLTDNTGSNMGGFVGFAAGKTTISGCYMNPITVSATKNTTMYNFCPPNTNLTVNNSYYNLPCPYSDIANQEQGVNVASLNAADLTKRLGNGWTMAAGNLRPAMYHGDNEANAGKFYFTSSGRATILATQTMQSSVVLSWETDGGAIDYFEVMRRRHTDEGSEEWKVISPKLDKHEYEDETVSPIYTYDYKVRSAVDCEGVAYHETNTIEGAHCVQTGKVEGYVRYADGTGIAGVSILVTSKHDSKTWSTKTKEGGYYSVEGLPYHEGVGQYTVGVVSNGTQMTLDTKDAGGHSIEFDAKTNLKSDVSFTVTSGYKFKGKVIYSGTNIPVKGVKFTVNGFGLKNAAGEDVETDADGVFSFRVGTGRQTIRAVKEGHRFSNDGYFKSKDGFEFTQDEPQALIQDSTKVKLIGRVAGGKDQGSLPLGNSLSKNNLGDNIKIVMALEGDNASWLVYDNLNIQRTERDTIFYHKSTDGKEHFTHMKSTRKRIEISPDPKTGEYEVWLPPVSWKVQQISCTGYATLFQSGKVGDVLDLTDSITLHKEDVKYTATQNGKATEATAHVEYHAIYNRIYHTPVQLTYKQISYDQFDYFGDKTYTAKDLAGNTAKVALAYQDDSGQTVYTLNHPVFSLEKKYVFKVSAHEDYYYNNDPQNYQPDVVKMKGGKVTIHNGLYSSTHSQEVVLDSVGEQNVVIQAAQTPITQTGDDALRTLTMTLELDSTFYEAKPLKAYVLNIYAKKEAKEILSWSKPQLVDVLRDPPGGKSFATLSKGSTLKYAFSLDCTYKLGLSIGIDAGTEVDSYMGAVAIAVESGIINQASSWFGTSVDLLWSGTGQKAYSYTMTAKEDISTSKDPLVVGADGDLYIGTETNIVLKPATAIRAIPDSMYVKLQGKWKGGQLLHIAQGTDNTGGIIHLVRDEVVGYGPQLKSTFVHSQKYIRTQIIPDLINQCKSLLFTGTEADAKKQADATGKPVYWSTIAPTDSLFGFMNIDNDGNYVYNTSLKGNRNDLYYKIIVPANASTNEEKNPADEIQRYYENMKAWMSIIAQNEKEKLEANELVKNFDVDGASDVTYSEEFTSDFTDTQASMNPVTNFQYGDAWPAIRSAFGSAGANIIAKIINKLAKKASTISYQGAQDKNGFTKINFAGFYVYFNLKPVLDNTFTPKYSMEEKYDRKESFTISMDQASNLNFDVYRVTANRDLEKTTDPLEVFTNYNFKTLTDETIKQIFNKHSDLKTDKLKYSKGFVYRTRSGATCRPYEGERISYFHSGGAVLDEATKKIENPVITLDKQSISSIPFGEPARFKIYMTNDSEKPEAAYHYFGLYLNEPSNTKGARLMLDGMPLTGNNRQVEVRPGKVTEKTLEVYPSEDFDYEDIKIGLISLNDVHTYKEVSLSVHYVPTAGSVTISTPGNKWLLNTDNEYEADKGYYMPVIIDGYNKNTRNFDHIELQYKVSSQGDNAWTNLCSYYDNDSLMALASGTKEKLPENGYIQTRFYGEQKVKEQAYDLRAVMYCRYGNGYLTASSPVLSGIKDVLRPALFGNPEPAEGVLNAGGNILFNFTEDIESNYLRSEANFEVVGETNANNISEEVSLQFSGNGSVETEALRNFADKNITIDMIINPDKSTEDMPLFSHGNSKEQIELWLTKDRMLMAKIGNNSYKATKALDSGGFRHVAMTLNQEEGVLKLFHGGTEVLNQTGVAKYNGYGTLTFGKGNAEGKASYYKGRMLEARVWYQALDGNRLTDYGFKRLSGYEMGLIDYYPMNEGEGEYAMDKAQGANAKLQGAAWALPRSMSLHISKEDKGVELKEDFMKRNSDQDYTLMFWFKTDANGHGALISNGSGKKTDVGPKDKFFIGFEGDKLLYRSNGMQIDIPGNYSDDNWHHYAMTVNRSHNLGIIYMDRKPVTTFGVDTLGGMVGGKFYLGCMHYFNQNEPTVEMQSNPLNGNMDAIALFAQPLPATLIDNFAKNGLKGTEMGLITYVDFCRKERMADNTMELKPYAYSQKIYKDNGNIVYELDEEGKPTKTPKRDKIFKADVKDIEAKISQNIGAPIKVADDITNLNFSFVGKNNQLLVNINEVSKKINKRNVYVTVREIPDKNGNYMASPATISVFVDNNPLKWVNKTKTLTTEYGKGATFQESIMNHSGKAHTYRITGLPKWLTVTPQVNSIGAQSEQTLTFTVNADLNVGTYDEIIYVMDENDLIEPIAITVRVDGYMPNWTVSNEKKQYSMNVYGKVYVDNEIVTDAADIIAAFDSNGNCLGTSHITVDYLTNESNLYLTIYNDKDKIQTPLNFRLWHYSTGKEMVLTPSEKILFEAQDIKGNLKNPIRFSTSGEYIQHLDLAKGWNWISFNVYSDDFRNVQNILKAFNWQEGDIFTDNTSGTVFMYKDGQWIDNIEGKAFAINPVHMYRIKVAEAMSAEFTGSMLSDKNMRTVRVHRGWNSIGYAPIINLPIATAMSDYMDSAEDGDVVKSRDQFAIFYILENGSRGWKGNLQYMKAGEGYMLYRKNATDTDFTYQFYKPGATYLFERASGTNILTSNEYASTMSLVAKAKDFDTEEGDKLVVYANDEERGVAAADEDGNFYISIEGDRQTALSFAIERNGDIIATAGTHLLFNADAIVGSPQLPTEISFVKAEEETGVWYSLQGIRLPERPTTKGVYIRDGKKVIVK